PVQPAASGRSQGRSEPAGTEAPAGPAEPPRPAEKRTGGPGEGDAAWARRRGAAAPAAGRAAGARDAGRAKGGGGKEDRAAALRLVLPGVDGVAAGQSSIGTGSGATSQISRMYSRIARSEENFPMRAAFRIDIRVHRSRSRHAESTRA